MAGCRRNGDYHYAAATTLGLACLTADAGDWSRAAVRHSTAQAHLNRPGQSWEEPEARYRQESLDQVRAHLGSEQTAEVYTRGLTLSFEDTLNLTPGQLSAPGWDAAATRPPCACRRTAAP